MQLIKNERLYAEHNMMGASETEIQFAYVSVSLAPIIFRSV